jgi:hypothetical protein
MAEPHAHHTPTEAADHDAEAYVRGFSRDLAARAGANDGAGVLARLTSDGGRAFMLLDAAVGDLA